MANITLIPLDVFPQLLNYDPVTGNLFWKHRSTKFFNPTVMSQEGAAACWNGRHGGKLAFTSLSEGYKAGRIFRIGLLAHQVIWALVYGEYAEEIDHENGDRADNRLFNLRDATRQMNMRNRSKNKNNSSGVTGVSFASNVNRWCAAITVDYRTIRLGYFDHLEDAATARKKAELTHNFHPNHGRD